jgi:co-chaperonin GroES (HSP10)
MPDSYKGLMAQVEQRAEVVEVGPACWDDERVRFLGIPLWKRPRAKPGDHVLVTKFAGHMAKGIKDDRQYRYVNDRDIFARIDDVEVANG